MSDIPSFAYRLLWGEREVASIANMTRNDARSFFAMLARTDVVTRTRTYALEEANRALSDLRAGALKGAAVLVP
jgi:alcohol dehydrogenase, propanol-preferring